MKINFADDKLQPLVSILSYKFFATQGVLERVGSLEENVTVKTETKFGTLAKNSQNGRFGSVGTAESNTTVEIDQRISLLKIDSLVLTDVSVYKTAVFQVMREGNEVGCVFNKHRNKLYLVHDYTDNIEVGNKPGDWQSLLKWAAIFFSAILGLFSILTLASPQITFVLLVFCAAFLALARSAELAAKQSQSNWDAAYGLLRKR